VLERARALLQQADLTQPGVGVVELDEVLGRHHVAVVAADLHEPRRVAFLVEVAHHVGAQQ
jgi:hypothetical protein